MSLVVFLIALVPAVVVVFVAGETRSRPKTVAAAVVAAAIGVATGNAAYMALDVGAVMVALWMGWKVAEPPDFRSPEQRAAEHRKMLELRAEEELREAEFQKTFYITVLVVAVGGSVAFLLWLKAIRDDRPHVTKAATPVETITKAKPTSESAAKPQREVKPKPKPRPAPVQKDHAPAYDEVASEKLRVCLERQGNGGLAKCLSEIE